MPRKNQNHYDDDFNSDDEPETLISRNRAPRKQRPVSGKRASRNTKRPSSPGKSRAHSVPAARSGRDLWINAIQKRQTLGIGSAKHSESPRHKTPIEYWLDTFRKTGGDSSTMNTFSGLKKTGDKNLAYLSTPHYLRQVVGIEKTGKNNNVTAKPSAGTPAYKTQEEYYDEVLSLRKKISGLNQDFATMKAKVRRLEEDNIKKEKEIENLLNPSKSDELRRTLGDKKPDSGAVIHSLKQKILKLEVQLREKEQSHVKLAAELKTTKIDEMKAQMEVFYQEIYRLQHSKDTGTDKGSRSGRESSTKVAALNETVIRLSKTNEQLQLENKGLKADLLRVQENGVDPAVGGRGEYQDMNRRELLAEIARLKKRAEKAERRFETDSLSMISFDSRRGEVAGKIVLQGTMEERLHQLDERETELLEEIEKQKSLIKRLKEELSRYRGHKDISSKPPTPRSSRTAPQKAPRSGSIEKVFDREVEEFSKKHAAKSIQQTWRQRQNRKREEERKFNESVEALRQQNAAKVIQKSWRKHGEEMERARKLEHLKQSHAARRIQGQWHKHRQYKTEVEREEAALDIQAALRGHHTRRSRLRQFDGYSTDGSEDYSDAVDLIKSSMRGHQARKQNLRRIRRDLTDTDDESLYNRRSSGERHSRPSSARSGSVGSAHLRNYADHARHYRSTYDEDDGDDDIMM
ncbi:IQ domain-containing protein E-like isoform X3 [Gigantopelta aegis]|uniref:IQ domain-containing protein E-like isoform X3 n=1 Tax=Gigantopelta aegis TaxID=1735272 RepID=UPI001B887E86|nr:IQ domain-containing protein E-like isoform X3 [Gigantopelta aegis]